MAVLSGIMAGASALAGLIGTFTNIAAQRRKEQQEAAAAARQEAHYNAEAAQNGLQTATAQAALNRMDRDAKRAMDQVDAKSVIMGGTSDIALAAQEQLAQAKADTASNITSNYETTVANPARQKAEEAREAHEQRLQEMQDQKIASAQNAITGALDAAGAIAGSIEPEKVSPDLDQNTPQGTTPQVNESKGNTGRAVVSGTTNDEKELWAPTAINDVKPLDVQKVSALDKLKKRKLLQRKQG